jgi:hypothetical protein
VQAHVGHGHVVPESVAVQNGRVLAVGRVKASMFRRPSRHMPPGLGLVKGAVATDLALTTFEGAVSPAVK